MPLLLAVVCTGSSGAETVTPVQGKTAIVYFSQTGNTRLVCEVLAKELPADLFELKIAKPPAAKGQLPQIEPSRIDLGPYSCVVVASPVWAANLVPAVRAFLKNNSLAEKKIVVLTTTNAAMPEHFQEKHKKLVADAGGSVAGYYQLVMMEEKDGKPVPREKADIQKDTTAIVAEIIKGISR